MDAHVDPPYDLTPHNTSQIMELHVDVKANVAPQVLDDFDNAKLKVLPPPINVIVVYVQSS